MIPSAKLGLNFFLWNRGLLLIVLLHLWHKSLLIATFLFLQSAGKSTETSKTTSTENLNYVQHSSDSLPNLSTDQCQSLLSLLQSHLSKAQQVSDANPSSTYVASICYSALSSLHSRT